MLGTALKKHDDTVQLISTTTSPAHAPARSTLDAAPSRAFAFLRTVGNDPKVAAALHACGYTDEDHTEGCDLLLAVAGLTNAKSLAAPVAPRMLAEQELKGWAVTGLRRARVALEHKNPAEAAFAFDGLGATQGPEAVLTIATFLDRCDALEGGAARKGTRKADHAALATLARRGVGEAERKRLRALVAASLSPNDGDAAAQPVGNDERTSKLLALHAWLQDWSETARTVIKNRAILIRLGAAKRRVKGATNGVPPGAVATPAIPAAPAPPAPIPVVVTPVAPPAPARPSVPQLPAASGAANGAVNGSAAANGLAKRSA